MCVGWACGFVHLRVGAHRDHIVASGAEITATLMTVLGTELGSSERIALSSEGISPGPRFTFHVFIYI